MTGRWTHHEGLVEPPLRLSAITYDDQGMHAPTSQLAGDESLLAQHLADGAKILAEAPEPGPHSPDLAEHTTSSTCAGSTCRPRDRLTQRAAVGRTMPVVKINAISVPPEAHEELEKRFSNRAHTVDGTPGSSASSCSGRSRARTATSGHAWEDEDLAAGATARDQGALR